MNKRNFLKTSFIGTLGLLSMPGFSRSSLNSSPGKVFVQPKLPYSFSSLEPFINKETLAELYTHNHAQYTNRLNKAYSKAKIQERAVRKILLKADTYPSDVVVNGAEFLNYKVFWKSISPNGGGSPSGAIALLIEKDYGSFENFKNEFTSVAKKPNNSGWVWLLVSKNTLKISSTAKCQNPNMNTLPAEQRGFPLLSLNVYEQTYQNQKTEYLNTFWNVVNWDAANVKLGRYRQA